MSILKPPIGPHDHVRGDPKAPVVLTEFGDFECPFCGRAFPVLKTLQGTFGNQLAVAFRHFPIVAAHPHALLCAEASEAAGAQGMFWEMHDLLYEHQEALALPYLEQYAAWLGLDLRQFNDDLRGHVYAKKTRDDLHSGAISGVNGTPTMFINGRRHDGSHDHSTLYRAIARTLAVETTPQPSP